MSIKDSGERTAFETGAVRDMHLARPPRARSIL